MARPKKQVGKGWHNQPRKHRWAALKGLKKSRDEKELKPKIKPRAKKIRQLKQKPVQKKLEVKTTQKKQKTPIVKKERKLSPYITGMIKVSNTKESLDSTRKSLGKSYLKGHMTKETYEEYMVLCDKRENEIKVFQEKKNNPNYVNRHKNEFVNEIDDIRILKQSRELLYKDYQKGKISEHDYNELDKYTAEKINKREKEERKIAEDNMIYMDILHIKNCRTRKQLEKQKEYAKKQHDATILSDYQYKEIMKEVRIRENRFTTKKHVEHRFKRTPRADKPIGDNQFYHNKLHEYAKKEEEKRGLSDTSVEDVIDTTLSYEENKNLIDANLHIKPLPQMPDQELKDRADENEAMQEIYEQELQERADEGDEEAKEILIEEKLLNYREQVQTDEYKKGFSLAKKYDSDVSKANNPYSENTEKHKAWNRGWNDYNPYEDKRKKEAYEISATGYLVQEGVHEPYIAEISPWQYQNLGKQAKREYDKKRHEEWNKSTETKDKWRKEIISDYDNKKISLYSPELHPDAKHEIEYEIDRRAKTQTQIEMNKKIEENKINSVDEIKEKGVYWDIISHDNVTVEKKFKRNVRIRDQHGRAYLVGPACLQKEKLSDEYVYREIEA